MFFSFSAVCKSCLLYSVTTMILKLHQNGLKYIKFSLGFPDVSLKCISSSSIYGFTSDSCLLRSHVTWFTPKIHLTTRDYIPEGK